MKPNVLFIIDSFEQGGSERQAMQLLTQLHASGKRSEEHTSELQSQSNLVCRLLLAKKKSNIIRMSDPTSSRRTYFIIITNSRHITQVVRIFFAQHYILTAHLCMPSYSQTLIATSAS